MKQHETVNRTLFLFPISSVVDTITNSSSELFVGVNPSKEELQAAIEAIYPEWETEYEELKSLDDLSLEEINMYFDYACSPHMWPATEDLYPILPGFTFDELYEPKMKDGVEEVAWNGAIQYELRNNVTNPQHKWDRDFVTEENREEILNKLDPDRHLFFMFSLDENPDWDMQEKLEKFMIRYHLG